MTRGIRILVALLAAALGGCATTGSVPDIPEWLNDNQGLLVARLYVPGSANWNNAQISIDGVLHRSNVRNGYIGIVLPPGEHRVEHLRIEGWNLSSAPADDADRESGFRKVRGGGYRPPTVIYTPGSSHTVYYTTLQVNRKFDIENGKVTNLGLIVYLPAPNDSKQAPGAAGKGKSFFTVAVDNSAEMNTYLATNYPKLVEQMKFTSVNLSPGKYLDAAKLPELRRLIAANETRRNKAVANSSLTAVYGDAGTIVTIKPGAKGQKPGVQVLDTGTLADIVDAQRDGERLLFLTSEGRLLTLADGKLSTTSLPTRMHAVRMRVFGNGGLAVVDNRMRLLTSLDRGATWVPFEGAMIESPRDDVRFAYNRRDLYLYLGVGEMPKRIVELRADDPTPRNIALPTSTAINLGRDSALVARDAGLFLVHSGTKFFFQPRGSQEWKLHSMPAEKCKPIAFDETGRNLSVECENVKYESGDSGVTWTRPSV